MESFDNIPNIVVLLILAGITITMIVSDDGIIKYAMNASDMANHTQNKVLQGIDKISNDLSDPYVEIPSNTPSGNGTASDIENYEKLAIIGTKVDYVPDDPDLAAALKANNIGWQLLYAGNEFSKDSSYHYYLILDNCLPSEYLPSSTDENGEKTYHFPYINGSGLSYKLNYTDVVGDYKPALDRIGDDQKCLNLDLLTNEFPEPDTAALAICAYLTDPLAWSRVKLVILRILLWSSLNSVIGLF